MNKYVIDLVGDGFYANEDGMTTDNWEEVQLFDSEEDAKWRVIELKEEHEEEQEEACEDYGYVYEIKEVEISFKVK